MPERSYSATTEGYRFGFNGYENEPDIAGQGSVIDFGARIYDSRLGRFFSTDPIVYPYWSPYQYDGNSPISVKDVLGMGPGGGARSQARKDRKRMESKGAVNVKTHTSRDKLGNKVFQNYGGGDGGAVASSNKYTKESFENKFSRITRGLRYKLMAADDYFSPTREGGKAATAVGQSLAEFHPAIPAYNLASRAGMMGDGNDIWGDDQSGHSAGWDVAAITPLGKLSKLGKIAKIADDIPVNRLAHIFGKAEHSLAPLLKQFGSEEKAFRAVQDAANQALKSGRITPNAKGILPSGDAGYIIDVAGNSVRLIGGRVVDGLIEISSFSMKGL
jgi:RHS repeat-associated protein|tara:strand:- start:3082 stop:4074 length:993 start_codon:yes stop_codon:yes gene_type:complete